ncbi:MAG: J domain-containing protein [Planctomycetes bacterium]|nr:J domain-containing protein [Planctomycetota bacterium]
MAPGAPPDVVNAAFRELAKRYHPDRFATLDEEFQALATRRMQQLMAARDAMLGG